jgi:glycine/D-amino acid oxidase-like deaminating enzyme
MVVRGCDNVSLRFVEVGVLSKDSRILMPDVVVIGGGHNGLVAAAYLAMTGLRVTVLERVRWLAARRRARNFIPASAILSPPTPSRF